MKKSILKKSISVFMTFMLALSLVATAKVTVRANTYQGATVFDGHTYCIFPVQKSWKEAEEYCEKIGGHLATITSAREQAFIKELNTQKKYLWIGGQRDDYFVWSWVTKEKWDYQCWNKNEPNTQGDETCACVFPIGWNDLRENSGEIDGLICEWDTPLKDATKWADTVSGWKNQATVFNGHSYFIMEKDLDWDEAVAFADLADAHLATVTSADEQKFLEWLNHDRKKLWLGGRRNDYFIWSWITGETWSYTHWMEGEPNNQGNEECLSLWPDEWNDLCMDSYEQSGFIMEWDSATNTKNVYQKQKQSITGLSKTITKKYKYKNLKKKKATFKLKGKALTNVSYKKMSGKASIKVDKKGTVTIPKKLKKGRYNVKVKASADSSLIYSGASKTITLKIVVK